MVGVRKACQGRPVNEDDLVLLAQRVEEALRGTGQAEIEAQEVFDNIQKSKDTVIVDVRTPHEYSRGFIAGSINIPVSELVEKIEREVPDKTETIYVYCLSGSRSTTAVAVMSKMGYANVFSMKSGLLAWRMNQLPLSTP